MVISLWRSRRAYAVGLVLAGSIIDRIGTRFGYAISLIVWSLAAIGHAFARTALGFGLARAALGLGEAGNFPAAVKTVAEWFPRKERALATGIFNAGSNVGAIVAPLVVPFLALHYGWPSAFLWTGALGLIWLLFWLPIYRRPEEHPRLTPAEFAYCRSDAPENGDEDSLGRDYCLIVRRGPSRGASSLTDPVWWFYLYWMADFLKKQYGIGLSQISLPLIAIYVVADFGSVGGGWLSSALIARGGSVNRGRKLAMLLCALCVVPVTFAVWTHHLWVGGRIGQPGGGGASGLVGQHLHTGIGPVPTPGGRLGGGGSRAWGGGVRVGGMLFAAAVGHILQWTHSDYRPIFFVCGFAYLIALGVIQLLAPRLTPVQLDEG